MSREASTDAQIAAQIIAGGVEEIVQTLIEDPSTIDYFNALVAVAGPFGDDDETPA